MSDTDTTTTRTAATGGLPSLYVAADVHAAADMDPVALADLVALVKTAARKVTDLDRDDVAQVAALVAAGLLTEQHGPSIAAAVAVRRVCHRMRLHRAADESDAAGSLTDEDRAQAVKDAEAAHAAGLTPLDRVAMARPIDPAAPFRTTDADRWADTLAALDPADAATGHALVTAEWKGGKAPAAAVRRALALPPVTGRAGTAWTAQVTADAPRILAALADARQAVLTEHHQGAEPQHRTSKHGAPRLARPIDQAGKDADQAAKAPRAGATRANADAPRVQDRPATSGPASQVVALRLIWAGPMVGHIDASTGTACHLPTVRRQASALAATLPTTLPAHRTGQERQERDTFDHEAAADAARGRRLPGVSVEADGTMVAPSGVSGAGAGSGKAALRHQAPRKSSRTGGTGATVPVTLTR